MKRPIRKTICAVSGGRADLGFLVAPLRALAADGGFSTKLVLTGQHIGSAPSDLAAEHDVEIAAELDMGLGADDPVSIAQAAGRALGGLAAIFAEIAPDLLLIVGDRYEILCCATAATIARIPIAHIAGGDLTEGAIDDTFRHAITKMSHLHFVTNAPAARRVRQLGEAAERIHVVGSTGLDLIKEARVPSREAFFRSVGLEPRPLNILLTFHPVTLAFDSLGQLEELLAACASFDDASILITGANADTEGRKIDARLAAFAQSHPHARLVSALGSTDYFAALSYMDVVVGNSSSGLYETPSFGIPSVNIGNRQKGRLRAASVFDCAPNRDAIRAALQLATIRGRQPTLNPYGDGHASERIVTVLKSIPDPRTLLNKTFIDLAAA
jgi:UDP-hydrolysing UDP-N-acetyl-D-glucosamine 2-epimerase